MKLVTREQLEGMKFAQLKELANGLNWKTSQTDSKKINFIGVSKAEVIDYILSTQREKQATELQAEIESEVTGILPLPATMEEMEVFDLVAYLNGAFPDEMDGFPYEPQPAPAPASEDVITLKVLASMLGMTEKSLRRKLRAMDEIKKPGSRWEWPAGHPDIDKLLNPSVG